jgi:hypothetical protein
VESREKHSQEGQNRIFNRSYYEDVLVVKVHRLYENQKLPDRCTEGDPIERRYEQIRNFEKYLWENGITIIKFFLHVSKDEQKKRIWSGSMTNRKTGNFQRKIFLSVITGTTIRMPMKWQSTRHPRKSAPGIGFPPTKSVRQGADLRNHCEYAERN